MKTIYAACLKSRLQLTIALGIAITTSGCAMRNTMSGGRETSVLGGVVNVETQSFQPIPPTTISVGTSKIVGDNGPSGNKVTLLWGLVTLHDY